MLVSKRSKKAAEGARDAGYIIIDVTSTSYDATFRKFSPAYPHGSIPVPGASLPLAAESVEGIWQGLKVFEREGADLKRLASKSAKCAKRAAGERRGRVLGHAYGSALLGYADARRQIYLPAYQHVLAHSLDKEVALLRGLLDEGQKLCFLDYETNADVADTSRPLSHASLLIGHLLHACEQEQQIQVCE